MAIYRVLKPLDTGKRVIQAGCFVRTGEMAEKTLVILAERGAVARIAPPPLAQLPGWKIRSARLAKAGIIDAEQFLEAEEGLLVDALKSKASLIQSWKAEVTHWLTIPQPEGG